MPNYQFAGFLSVVIKSQAEPLSGQKNRSSDNYDFRYMEKGKKLIWNCPENISFNVMEDKVGTDPVTFSNVKNNVITDFPSDSASNGLYIANPKNAESEFEIRASLYEGPSFSNWMSFLPDSKNISELAIPGTHDSGATSYFSYLGRCQTRLIFEQLYNKGVRFLDIRCKVTSGRLGIYHGPIYQWIYLDDVLRECQMFLTAFPKESIIMSIKNESTDSYDAEFEEVFYNNYFNNNSFWYSENKIPDLGSTRGKIIIFRRFKISGGKTLGIDVSSGWEDNETFTIQRNDKSIRIQDNYEPGSNDKKKEYIKNLLDESLNKENWCINFASAILSKIPPDPAAVSNVINPWLNSLDPNFTGALLMDYIDQSSEGETLNVASQIIKHNF